MQPQGQIITVLLDWLASGSNAIDGSKPNIGPWQGRFTSSNGCTPCTIDMAHLHIFRQPLL